MAPVLQSLFGMGTKHTHPVVFGRKVNGCPRCAELTNGAAPRRGWGDAKRRFEDASRRAIAAHDCRTAGCGPVCTYGDW